MKKNTKKKSSKKSPDTPNDEKVSVVATNGGGSGLDAVSAALDSATVNKSTKSKSPKWFMNETRNGLISAVRKAYQAVNDAKASFDKLTAEVRTAVSPFYRDKLAEGVEFVNTVQLSDGEESIQVQFKHAYSKIPTEQEASLREVVGEQYDKFFKKTANIAVKPEIIGNSALLKELVDKMGMEFVKYFTVEQFIVPTESFTETRFSTLSKDQNAQLDGFVKQYAPSVKVR